MFLGCGIMGVACGIMGVALFYPFASYEHLGGLDRFYMFTHRYVFPPDGTLLYAAHLAVSATTLAIVPMSHKFVYVALAFYDLDPDYGPGRVFLYGAGNGSVIVLTGGLFAYVYLLFLLFAAWKRRTARKRSRETATFRAKLEIRKNEMASEQRDHGQHQSPAPNQD